MPATRLHVKKKESWRKEKRAWLLCVCEGYYRYVWGCLMLIWCPTRDASWTYLWSWPVHGAEMKSASMRSGRRLVVRWTQKCCLFPPLGHWPVFFNGLKTTSNGLRAYLNGFSSCFVKTNIAVPTWADLRPITVAASLYRLWARVRASRILGVLKDRGAVLVRVNLPTNYHLGFCLWFFWITRTIEKPKVGSLSTFMIHNWRIFWYNCYPPGN